MIIQNATACKSFYWQFCQPSSLASRGPLAATCRSQPGGAHSLLCAVPITNRQRSRVGSTCALRILHSARSMPIRKDPMTQPQFPSQPQPHYPPPQQYPPVPQYGSAPQYGPIPQRGSVPQHAPSPQYPAIPQPQGPLPAARPEGSFRFDGGAGSFFLIGLGAVLLVIITLGLAMPWAVAMYYQWQTSHTIVNGRRLRFNGSGGSLFGHYIKWWFLTIITFGIYGFWVWPRMTRWVVEHQDFA